MRKRDVATDLTVVLAMVHDPRRGFDSGSVQRRRAQSWKLKEHKVGFNSI